MADMIVHKDILHSRGGHPRSYMNLIFDSHSSSPIKAKVDHSCFPIKHWECSTRVIWTLNREQTHFPSPPKKILFCTSHRVANSPEETLSLREALQKTFSFCLFKEIPWLTSDLAPHANPRLSHRRWYCCRKGIFGSWHLWFTAAEEAPWVVGAFGFPSAADRQKGDNSKGKGREEWTIWDLWSQSLWELN